VRSRSGRLVLSRLGLLRLACPAWAASSSTRLGRPPSNPAGPVRPRVGLLARSPGWAGFPAPAGPRLGLRRFTPAGPASSPGWAARLRLPARPVCRLGRLPLQARPPFVFPDGPDYTVPAGPGRDPWPRPDYSQGRPRYALPGRIILLQGRITPLLDEIYSLRDILLVQHRLQRIVPVLGRL
jgi:hypothetical protein